MTQSVKLGTVSVVVLASTLIPPFSNWRYPMTFACVGLSGLLGLLAARQGSKWWLATPGMIIGGLAFGLYLGLHSF